MSWQVVNMVKLDEGGFSDVYLGVRSDTGEQVVVKFLRDDTPDNRRYFRREAKILARMLHQRIAGFLGFNENVPRPFIIMPYYPGGKLTRLAGQLNHAQIRIVARHIAEPIAALHAQKIAHGDVKPDNVLLTQAGDLRLADPLGNGAGCTVLLGANGGGTPGYWAPEVARGAPISAKGDVFSFGVTLFHIVTGRRPADGENLDPRAHGVLVPDDVRAIIIACCRNDPRQRPGMRSILAALPTPEAAAQPVRIAPKSSSGDDLLKGLLAVGGLVALAALISEAK